MSADFTVHRATGSAAGFHARPLPDPAVPAVHVLTVDRPALVLGSAQRDDAADRAACDAAGVEVVRRRSGGGAVLLEVGGAVWVDVEIPRGHRRWHDDIGRAAWWVGEAWAGAVGGAVHRGPMAAGRWGRLVCFAGLGPGEVTAAEGGPKVVGISQRRTRAGARFQCAVPLRWEPARLAGLLALDDGARAELVADLATAVAPVEDDADAVVDAFLSHL